ncbi:MULTISPECIES: hypothetical protein [unclassified Leifsonia]|uniref:hypothetical protein n=1 Tax=unclassified Leifsonia TaxID=2663824 RepID=UPI0008A7AC62|nr:MULTISPECIES: hypothetical protein [unclassified Leifsonia]SEH57163.1 hypothetical protein SAMN04515694_101160 [Leifsonia sp. CL154]SFL21688.1 hypothetical protein SAMN04515692_101319 [Leifsonia sp. CL147]
MPRSFGAGRARADPASPSPRGQQSWGWTFWFHIVEEDPARLAAEWQNAWEQALVYTTGAGGRCDTVAEIMTDGDSLENPAVLATVIPARVVGDEPLEPHRDLAVVADDVLVGWLASADVLRAVTS